MTDYSQGKHQILFLLMILTLDLSQALSNPIYTRNTIENAGS